MPNAILLYAPYMRQRPMLYYEKTGALSQYTLDMGHTGERDPGRSIKAQLLRPSLNRTYRINVTYRTYGTYKSYKSHRSYRSRKSYLEKQDVDGCGDTFITVALRTDHRPVRKYDSPTADCRDGGAGLLRRRKQVNWPKARIELIRTRPVQAYTRIMTSRAEAKRANGHRI